MQLTSTEKIEKLPLDLCSNEAAIRKNMRKAGEAIFEIGKHLKHVKESVIESGKWTEWLQSMDIEPRQAQRFIQVYTELSEHASALSGQSLTKLLTLAQISSTVGDIAEVIEKSHTLPGGQTKTIDEMTSRELDDLKKRLAKSESDVTELLEQTYALEGQVESAQKSERIAISQLEQALEQEPEIIEVIPEEMQRKYEEMVADSRQMEQSLAHTYERIAHLEKLEKVVRSQEESPMYDLTRSLQTVNRYFDTFTATQGFMETAIASAEQTTVDALETQFKSVQARMGIIQAEIDARKGIVTIDCKIIDGDFIGGKVGA
ncbi:DUF3102 domain-containing protein [Solibacillus sp. FSL H8-0538]|uniref:DUF3102 domain-containing protein n=1 Tax=Solibacillus sp. FSL H8-0538 TaxID=2921400 RepID=UPI0030F5AF95